MKQIWSRFFVVCAMIMFCSVGVVYAGKDIGIVNNGKQIVFPDEKPFVDKNNRTMVPLRFVSQHMGYQVTWDGKTSKATIQDKKNIVQLKTNSDVIIINGVSKKMDTKMILKNGRTFVPLRFITQAFQGDIMYDAKTKQVKITTPLASPIFDSLQMITVMNQESFVISGKGEGNATIDFLIKDAKNGIVKGSVKTNDKGIFQTKQNVKTLADGDVSIEMVQTKNGLKSGKVTKQITKYNAVYRLNAKEQKRWNISDDGSNPSNTTKGLNDSLVWAQKNGIQTFQIPKGIYTVKMASSQLENDSSACINMVSNMTLSLENEVIIKKETNAKEKREYNVLCIGKGIENVTIKGGTYIGDTKVRSSLNDNRTLETGALEKGNGIIIHGAKNVTVEGVKVKEFTQSGIHIEGEISNNVTIKNSDFSSNWVNGVNINDTNDVKVIHNTFQGNQKDFVLNHGQKAVIEENTFTTRSKGLIISDTFTDTTIKNNTFHNSDVYVKKDAKFIGNNVNDSLIVIEGQNISIDGMKLYNYADIDITNTTPFSITMDNVTLEDSGLSLYGKPVHFQNITFINEGYMYGNSENGNIFDNFNFLNMIETDLVNGTYNQCTFENDDINEHIVLDSGEYMFNECDFKLKDASLIVYDKNSNVTIQNSKFNGKGKKSIIEVSGTNEFNFINNTVVSDLLPEWGESIIEIGDDKENTNLSKINKVNIQGNTITATNQVDGIRTIYAGLGAPPYRIENNTLYNAKLNLKPEDIQNNNQELAS